MNQNKLIIVGKNDKISVKNFDNINEFEDFYKLHEDEINKLSTVKLNKMFHIKDYKIIRRKIDGNEDKTLGFQQIFKTNNESNDDSRYEELNNRLKLVEIENTKIKNQLIEIIKVINQN